MRILLLNQVFYPDQAATALYLTDLAMAMSQKGHSVTVLAASRGYNNPDTRFPSQERWRGIEIRRIWTPGLGKRAMWRRIVDAGVFWLNAARLLFFAPRPDVILSLTSPPLISVLGATAAKWHGCRSMIWLMDMNPDQAVANGVLRKGSFIERALSAFLNWSFQQAARIVVLDRFMASRLSDKGVTADAIHIEPPWSHDHDVKHDVKGRDAFRFEHGLNVKFVVMYSGNHSPCHPLDTLLEAALKLRATHDFQFLFIGGGSEHQKAQRFAERNQLSNITCLPYQSPEKLSASLSAADLHIVALGDPYVGIVHPCKIYNILSMGLPFLFIGPSPSHGSDMVNDLQLAEYVRQANHGDVDAVVRNLQAARALGHLSPSAALQDYSRRFGFEQVCPRLVSEIESIAKTV